MASPIWAPSLADVGAYVISRTVVAETDGVPANTFTDDTYPTASQVAGIVSNVSSWITGKAGVVGPAFYELANTAAALRTAGLIQLSFPVREGDVDNAAQLLGQAKAALDDLVTAQAAGAGHVPAVPRPTGNFPAAPTPIRDFAEPPRWRY